MAKTKSTKSNGKGRSSKKAAPVAEKNFYCGGTDSPSAQKMLARINKTSAAKPLVAKKALGDKPYPNRVARVLATLGLVKTESREGIGRVYFPA